MQKTKSMLRDGGIRCNYERKDSISNHEGELSTVPLRIKKSIRVGIELENGRVLRNGAVSNDLPDYFHDKSRIEARRRWHRVRNAVNFCAVSSASGKAATKRRQGRFNLGTYSHSASDAQWRHIVDNRLSRVNSPIRTPKPLSPIKNESPKWENMATPGNAAVVATSERPLCKLNNGFYSRAQFCKRSSPPGESADAPDWFGALASNTRHPSAPRRSQNLSQTSSADCPTWLRGRVLSKHSLEALRRQQSATSLKQRNLKLQQEIYRGDRGILCNAGSDFLQQKQPRRVWKCDAHLNTSDMISRPERPQKRLICKIGDGQAELRDGQISSDLPMWLYSSDDALFRPTV